jgi:hypothetical protein
MIDYYGTDANYIHAKFGDLRKNYNFTDEFVAKYPNFSSEYGRYFSNHYSVFSQPQQIVDYVEKYKIPVHFYKNYTDEPATIEDMHEYFESEIITPKNLDGESK